MTTRNFRVNNGISIGDVVIDASTNKITGLSTSAPSADGDVATKIYVDDSINAISTTSITTDSDATNVAVSGTGASGTITVTANSNTEMTVTDSGMQLGGSGARVNTILDDDTMSADSDTALATQQSIKAYIDNGLGALSATSITTDSDATNVTVSGTGASGTITMTANSNTELTVTDAGVRVHGNLTVDGSTVTINTTTLSVEDNIIEVNRNISSAAGMPNFSGLKANRGETGTATEEDLFWVWDETFSDDGTSIYGNAGGAWTAYRSSDDLSNKDLVDIRANVVHAVSTSAQYADVAERFEADAPMSAGAVVEVGGTAEITETTSDLSENVFGVISDMPAYAMNAAAGNNESHPYVAMTGRTPVRVTGAVTKGQRLVTSSVKGCARAVAAGESISPFHVIGRALETNTDEGIKLVNCAVRTNN